MKHVNLGPPRLVSELLLLPSVVGAPISGGSCGQLLRFDAVAFVTPLPSYQRRVSAVLFGASSVIFCPAPGSVGLRLLGSSNSAADALRRLPLPTS